MALFFSDCEECKDFRKTECKKHPFSVVLNQEVSKKCLFGEPWCVSIYRSKIEVAGIGAFASCHLPKNVRFGPYVGLALPKSEYQNAPESGYAWMIEEKNEEAFYVDGCDRQRSNWMRVSYRIVGDYLFFSTCFLLYCFFAFSL